jgi:hypothetical protein
LVLFGIKGQEGALVKDWCTVGGGGKQKRKKSEEKKRKEEKEENGDGDTEGWRCGGGVSGGCIILVLLVSFSYIGRGSRKSSA